MYENLNDELYFGEVYRTILQEAWLPEGAQVWQRTGISRRGRRPTQQGLYAHSPTGAQAVVRQGFHQCVAAWNALPWDTPFNPPCDDRLGKDHWKQEKDDRGLMCSYFDVFMKDCLSHWTDTGCIPSRAYKLEPSPPDLKDVTCYSEHIVTFAGACGDVHKYQGPGSYSGNIWTAPLCGTDGLLHFTDANGALGCLPYVFHPIHECNGPTWPASNPDLINKNQSKTVSIEGGISPFTWFITGTDFTLASGQTTARSNTVHAGPAACGTAYITVKDVCDQEIAGTIRCVDGQWVSIDAYVCTPPCDPNDKEGCGAFGLSCIKGAFRYCYVFCPSPCKVHCPANICDECGPNYYNLDEWQC